MSKLKNRGILCPRCLTENYCPCPHCTKHRISVIGAEEEEKLIAWKWVEGGEVTTCGKCGLQIDDFEGPYGREKAMLWREKNPGEILV